MFFSIDKNLLYASIYTFLAAAAEATPDWAAVGRYGCQEHINRAIEEKAHETVHRTGPARADHHGAAVMFAEMAHLIIIVNPMSNDVIGAGVPGLDLAAADVI